jgi:hypothetical protein
MRLANISTRESDDLGTTLERINGTLGSRHCGEELVRLENDLEPALSDNVSNMKHAVANFDSRGGLSVEGGIKATDWHGCPPVIGTYSAQFVSSNISEQPLNADLS